MVCRQGLRVLTEWKAAYILNKKPIPDKPPTLNGVVRLVARLGGRTGDGEPGVKTIWLGNAAHHRLCRRRALL